MLRPILFTGSEKQLLRTSQRLWRDLSSAIAPVVVGFGGELQSVRARRVLTFFDTAKKELYQNAFILRERRDLNGRKRELTLKFRHPDRYVSEDHNIAAAKDLKSKVKFEEDIKVRFASFYSLSNSIVIDGTTDVSDFRDVARLFPDLGDRMKGMPDRRPITRVGDFTASELVISGTTVRLGRTPPIDAECALIVWYGRQRREEPIAVEFSYRYGDKSEDYGGRSALRAFDMFHILQTRLTKWVDLDGRTKTELVYETSSR